MCKSWHILLKKDAHLIPAVWELDIWSSFQPALDSDIENLHIKMY